MRLKVCRSNSVKRIWEIPDPITHIIQNVVIKARIRIS